MPLHSQLSIKEPKSESKTPNRPKNHPPRKTELQKKLLENSDSKHFFTTTTEAPQQPRSTTPHSRKRKPHLQNAPPSHLQPVLHTPCNHSNAIKRYKMPAQSITRPKSSHILCSAHPKHAPEPRPLSTPLQSPQTRARYAHLHSVHAHTRLIQPRATSLSWSLVPAPFLCPSSGASQKLLPSTAPASLQFS
jgi:hypothetical protein